MTVPLGALAGLRTICVTPVGPLRSHSAWVGARRQMKRLTVPKGGASRCSDKTPLVSYFWSSAQGSE
jgi:hypothetical protein